MERLVLSAFIRYYHICKYLGAKNLLGSKHYPEQIVKALDYVQGTDAINPITGERDKGIDGVNLIIDSGAFSVWNAGGKLDVMEYIEFLRKFEKEHRSKFNEVWYVNLDVIPGKQGESPTMQQINDAIEEGFKNYDIMRNEFDNVIHVFHQGDSEEALLRLLDTKPAYIGISPSNDVMTPQRTIWLDETFKKVPKEVRTHGFAVTSFDLMKSFDWFSVDSTSWFMIGMYGKLSIPFNSKGKVVLGDDDVYSKKEISVSVEKASKGPDGYKFLMQSHKKGNKAFLEQVNQYIEYLCKRYPFITPSDLFCERNQARVFANLNVFLDFERQGKRTCNVEVNSLF